MQTYKVSKKKEKEVYKNYIKQNIWKCGNFVKFSYVFEKILLIAAVILGVLNIVNVVFFSHEPLYLIFLVMTVGFPFGISLIFKTVYEQWILKDFTTKENEIVQLSDTGIQYSYVLKYLWNWITFDIPFFDVDIRDFLRSHNIEILKTGRRH